MGEGLDNRIISLYSKGMSYQNIQEHLDNLYGLEISTGHLAAITNKIPWLSNGALAPWNQFMPLWLDAVHFKVRQDGKVISKAAYHIVAIDLQGSKDLLGIYIGDAASTRKQQDNNWEKNPTVYSHNL